MDNTGQHWPICREFSSKIKFQKSINSFMVLGEWGECLLIVTEDGKGYFYKVGYDEPILWNVVSKIVDAAQGKTHALILDQEGKIYLYGGNFLKTADELKNCQQSTEPLLIPNSHKFISVKCGELHCLALTKDGKVFAWGKNESYQVGHCNYHNLVCKPHFKSELDHLRIVAIACGGSHSLALTDGGDVYSWGGNSRGQIGNLENIDYGSGKVDFRLNSKDYRPLRIKTPSTIKAMAAGRANTLLLSHDGKVYTYGYTLFGLYSRKSTEYSMSSCSKIVDGLPPICQIGSHFSHDFSIAISFDRTCFVWNLDFIKVPLKLPMCYSTIDSVRSLFSSSQCLPNLVRVQETSKLGQLFNCLAQMFDNPESSDVQFVVQDKIIHAHRSILRNASRHLDQMFSTKTWCSDDSMKTRKIVIADHSYPVFHAYLRFLYTDCLPEEFEIITELLKLANSYQEVPLQQKCCARLQCNIPGTMAQLEGDSSISYWPILQEISADFLENVQSFMVMGKQINGVLMITNNGDVYRFGTIWDEKDVDTPTKLDVSNIIQMAHGENHILLLNQQGQIFANGLNDCGQLGWRPAFQDFNDSCDYNYLHYYLKPRLISSPYRFVSIQCGKDHSLALTEDGVVFGWGSNIYCQVARRRCRSHPTLNRISELRSLRVVQIACGQYHSLALIDDGSVFSWGFNQFNQLDHCVEHGKGCCRIPTRMEIQFPIKSISAGKSHSCLLTQCGQVYLCFKYPMQRFSVIPEKQRLEQTNNSLISAYLHKIPNLPPISHVESHFEADLSFAFSSFDKSCHCFDPFGEQSKIFLCPKIDFALSFKSSRRNTLYSFKFEGPKTNFLLNCMTRMLDNPESSDIQFVVEENSRIIHAHRVILQNSSSYFERMFSKTWWYSNPDNSMPKIIIPDYSYSVVYAYLLFLYTRRLQISANVLTKLFELAIYYVEDRLQQLCLERMWCDLSVENCCHYYQLTERYDSSFPQSFIRNLIQFILVRIRLVYSSEGYRTLDQTQQHKLSLDIEHFVM